MERGFDVGKTRRALATIVALTATAGAALGAAGLVASPAQAALTETEYGLQGTAYGTRVLSGTVGLDSGRSAFSYISCTRLAGRSDAESAVSVAVPADDPYVTLDAVQSRTRTFSDKANDIAAAVEGENTIGEVRLGNSTTPQLTISGLKSTSTAWATNSGKLKTANKMSSVTMGLKLPSGTPVSGPLQQLVDAATLGINQVIALLLENAEGIEVPGLGKVSVGFDRQVQGRYQAQASSFVLRVDLYGLDRTAGTDDDTMVGIGRSWARIYKDIPAAIMDGVGYGSDVELLDGLLRVGRLGEQPLACRGTNGTVDRTATAALDPLRAGALELGVLTGRAFGEQSRTGVARAWTEGSVASLKLGPLKITGITGRANVAQDRFHRITRKDIKGSSLGKLVYNGKSYGEITPATVGRIPRLAIDGVARIEFFKRSSTSRGTKVSAVVITLLEQTAGESKVRLGNAEVALKGV